MHMYVCVCVCVHMYALSSMLVTSSVRGRVFWSRITRQVRMGVAAVTKK